MEVEEHLPMLPLQVIMLFTGLIILKTKRCLIHINMSMDGLDQKICKGMLHQVFGEQVVSCQMESDKDILVTAGS
jgi:hypothetical protein